MNYRRIKFRVVNEKTKEWIHGGPNEVSDLDGVNIFGETILLGEFMRGVQLKDLNDCVALEFTGLIDKNGKEVFEGDIVKCRFNMRQDVDNIGVVEFDHKYCNFGIRITQDNIHVNCKEIPKPFFNFFTNDGRALIEVVGNYYI